MSSVEQGSTPNWKEEGHRETFYGLDLTLRKDLATGELSTVVLGPGWVSEIQGSEAKEAYAHPVVTPGLDPESIAPTPITTSELWDKALDALNELSPAAKHSAVEWVDKTRAKGLASHALVMEAAKRISHQRGLPRPTQN